MKGGARHRSGGQKSIENQGNSGEYSRGGSREGSRGGSQGRGRGNIIIYMSGK